MLALARALPAIACCLWALLAARPATPRAPIVASSPHFTNPTGPPNAIQWLVVSPRDPRTLYVGRYACPMVFLRSRDAGRTWRNLLDAAQICINGSGGPGNEGAGGNTLTGPLLIAADGRTLFLDEEYNENSADYLSYFLRSSTDGGDHWPSPDPGEDYGSGTLYAALGPPRPHGSQFLYTYEYYGPEFADPGDWVSYGDITGHSPDGGKAGAGASPDSAAGAPGSCCNSAPVPDARDPTIVYVNLQSRDSPDFAGGGAVRSEHGRPWAVVAQPRARPPLRTFSVATDPHEAGLLVGRTQDRGVPPDRVYLSADHGRTWRVAACPGVLRGSCPAATLDDAFGAGASYAFVGDGLYRFHGAGPATARLPLSARLPAPSRAIAAVAGGPRPGDPLYLTLKGPSGGGAPVFYRTLDTGRTWQRVAVPTPPPH